MTPLLDFMILALKCMMGSLTYIIIALPFAIAIGRKIKKSSETQFTYLEDE